MFLKDYMLRSMTCSSQVTQSYLSIETDQPPRAMQRHADGADTRLTALYPIEGAGNSYSHVTQGRRCQLAFVLMFILPLYWTVEVDVLYLLAVYRMHCMFNVGIFFFFCKLLVLRTEGGIIYCQQLLFPESAVIHLDH